MSLSSPVPALARSPVSAPKKSEIEAIFTGFEQRNDFRDYSFEVVRARNRTLFHVLADPNLMRRYRWSIADLRDLRGVAYLLGKNEALPPSTRSVQSMNFSRNSTGVIGFSQLPRACLTGACLSSCPDCKTTLTVSAGANGASL